MELDPARLDVTADGSGSQGAGAARGGSLTLIFNAERPLSPSVTWDLASHHTVSIGRAQAGTAQEDSKGELRLQLPDRFVSAPHASLHKVYGKWLLHDEGSRHGTFVEGAKIERCELRDGALVELGRSFFLFRESQPAAVSALPASLATHNQPFAAQLEALLQMASTVHPIVVRGATGTGKEVVAREIHRLSKRRGSFQAINCAALAQSVAEAELFGYRKGAFSNAAEDRPGLIRSAEGGTLFLDEIGDLPLPMQGLFLRVLQEREVTPVGATKPIAVDFRLIAATHRDVEAMAAAGTFRPDLLARLQGFTLSLPSLRDRREDLGALIASLLQRHAGARADGLRFSLAAARALFMHPWPLNVRELEKVLAVAVSLNSDGRIDLPQLPPALREMKPVPAPAPLLSSDGEQRRAELEALLQEHKGNITAVAKALGKARMQVQRWLTKYKLDAAAFR